MEHWWQYILTWRLPIAIVFVVLAALPVREAFRSLRISATQFGRDFTEQIFLSSILLTIAGGVYPYILCLLPLVLYLFHRRHILDARGVWAWLLAIALFCLYYGLLIRLGWISNAFAIFF